MTKKKPLSLESGVALTRYVDAALPLGDWCEVLGSSYAFSGSDKSIGKARSGRDSGRVYFKRAPQMAGQQLAR
jgi:hypothetical protein